MKKIVIISCVLAFVLSFLFLTLFSDEGMWPISEIHKLDLQSKGLKISPKEIYNPDGISLIDGICQVGGCTGSFVSSDGLILTNHHCAYGALQAASTEKSDYIKNGFLARNRSEEIPAIGYTVRITESYEDVSKEVLSVVKKGMDLAARTKAIEKKTKKIVAAAEKKNPGKRAEVAEMFIGKTYVLFIFTYLEDIRLVYSPPRSIGEFGGETDNWMWPRHTGDFSYMRAYTASGGSPSKFSPSNVPYHPKRVIQVAPEGVNEGDFVFILGYPGRTYRHQTSHYLAYEEDLRMPYVADWYAWQISVMEKMGEEDRAVVLRHLSRIKGLSNTMKNYRGKLKGLKRLSLVERKRKEEKDLQTFIDADPKRKTQYGNIFGEMQKVYKDIREQAEYELTLDYLRRSVNLVSYGYTLYEASIELRKKDIERESAYMNRNFPRTKQRLKLSLQNYYEPTDKVIFKEILMRAAGLSENTRIDAIDKIIGDQDPETAIDSYIENAYSSTQLDEERIVMDTLENAPKKLDKIDDPFLDLAEDLYPSYLKLKETRETRRGALDQLYAELVDVKRQFLKTDFVPDANRTLRLTFGRIKGYEPVDAVYYQPITTADGVFEKTSGEEPFDTPQKLMDLISSRNFGRFEHPELKSVPVCILYDMDTTGGNSGSPVLNAKGELVGINFDRAYEATINDYAWSQIYSRSIAVDIRYVLWVTQKFGEVGYLLDELNVER
jgi:hypothetical protein